MRAFQRNNRIRTIDNHIRVSVSNFSERKDAQTCISCRNVYEKTAISSTAIARSLHHSRPSSDERVKKENPSLIWQILKRISSRKKIFEKSFWHQNRAISQAVPFKTGLTSWFQNIESQRDQIRGVQNRKFEVIYILRNL